MILHRNETEYKALKATNKESKKIKKNLLHTVQNSPLLKDFTMNHLLVKRPVRSALMVLIYFMESSEISFLSFST